MRALLFALLIGCGFPQLAPETRPFAWRSVTLADIRVGCSGDEDPLSSTTRGTGVLVNNYQVVTAAHVVRCAEIPQARVEVRGRTRTMTPVKDDQMFGSGRDLALLQVTSAEPFDDKVAPVVLDPGWEGPVYLETWQGEQHGMLAGNHLTEVDVVVGDSGAPVYTPEGKLVGVLVTKYEAAGESVREGGIERLNLGWRF